MSMVTPTLTLAPPPSAPSASAKAAAAASIPAATPTAAPKPSSVPSTTVTLSPEAMSAMAAASYLSAPPSASAEPVAPAPQDHSVYESLKNGIASAVADVGLAIEGGAHAVVDGVEAVVSTANKTVQGILELPFAAVAKTCDAAGAVIDAI